MDTLHPRDLLSYPPYYYKGCVSTSICNKNYVMGPHYLTEAIQTLQGPVFQKLSIQILPNGMNRTGVPIQIKFYSLYFYAFNPIG